MQNKAVDFLEGKFEEQWREKQMPLTLLETLFGTQEGDSISIGWNLESTLLWTPFSPVSKSIGRSKQSSFGSYTDDSDRLLYKVVEKINLRKRKSTIVVLLF